jgi:sugar phosphate isomerase/epimerase
MATTAPIDLIGCYWTLAGRYEFGEHDESPWDFRDRVEAAARAGYRGIGLKIADLRRVRAKYGYAGMRSLLEDHDLRHLEVEALFYWFATGEARAASDRDRHDLFEAASELGAHHVKCCGDFNLPGCPLTQLHDEFQVLASEARDRGVTLALEFLPVSNVNSLRKTLDVLGESAGRGAGVMLDVWHVTRTRTPFAEIAALPASFIACAELDDGTIDVVASELEDTLNERRLPGEGEFDVPGFVRAVLASGYDGPFGVEIISHEQRARPLEEAARRSFDASMSQVRKATEREETRT